MSTGFAGWTIPQLTAAFRGRTVSPVDVAAWALSEAGSINGRFGTVFTHIAEDEAMAMARAAERRWRANEALGPLDGVPLTIKNLLAVTGWPLDFCSLTSDPASRATFDAPAVARLREAGMVFIGYTATPEFSWKLVTDSPKYGTVLNPNDPQRTAGGSSGGAAASAAAGIAPVNLGSDAAGSIRVPASFCGVFGMKPTFGTVAAYPAGPLSHVGPLGRDIGDAAMVLDAIGRPDRRDWYNTPFSRQDAFSRKLGRPLRGLRIAYTSSLCGLDALPEVRTAVERVVPALEGMGATVKETEPTVADPREAARVLFSGGYVNRFRAMDESSRARADSGLVAFAEAAKTYTADDVRRAYEQRYLIGCQFSLFFENFDLLVTPTTICPAFKLGQNAPDGFTDDIVSWSVFTYIFNLTQNPAASVPWGRLANGLPIGVQIVGPKFGDADVLMACKALCDLNPLS